MVLVLDMIRRVVASLMIHCKQTYYYFFVYVVCTEYTPGDLELNAYRSAFHVVTALNQVRESTRVHPHQPDTPDTDLGHATYTLVHSPIWSTYLGPSIIFVFSCFITPLLVCFNKWNRCHAVDNGNLNTESR